MNAGELSAKIALLHILADETRRSQVSHALLSIAADLEAAYGAFASGNIGKITVEPYDGESCKILGVGEHYGAVTVVYAMDDGTVAKFAQPFIDWLVKMSS